MDHPLDNLGRSQGCQGFKASEVYHEFKGIKMEEDKSFDEFYAQLKDIVNSSFNLAETILEPKIAKKVLRSVLRDFMPRSLQLRNQRILTKFL